jgi:hypothetical protein
MPFLISFRLCRSALALMILVSFCAVSTAQERTISPWEATVKSAILPGWGQFVTGGRIKAVVSLAGVYGLVAASLIARASYRNIYNDKYVPAVLSGSPESDRYYELANQRYKLSRGLAFAAVGVWAYSMIDSYVSCVIRNAQVKARKLKFNTKRIDKFDLEYKTLEGELRIEARTEF